jgi:hypothetical protein
MFFDLLLFWSFLALVFAIAICRFIRWGSGD